MKFPLTGIPSVSLFLMPALALWSRSAYPQDIPLTPGPGVAQSCIRLFSKLGLSKTDLTESLYARYKAKFREIFPEEPEKVFENRLQFSSSLNAGAGTEPHTAETMFHAEMRKSLMFPAVDAHEKQHVADIRLNRLPFTIADRPTPDQRIWLETRAFARQFKAMKTIYAPMDLVEVLAEPHQAEQVKLTQRFFELYRDFQDDEFTFIFLAVQLHEGAMVRGKEIYRQLQELGIRSKFPNKDWLEYVVMGNEYWKARGVKGF